MDEEVAESWEEAADSGVNTETHLHLKTKLRLLSALYLPVCFHEL